MKLWTTIQESSTSSEGVLTTRMRVYKVEFKSKTQGPLILFFYEDVLVREEVLWAEVLNFDVYGEKWKGNR